MTTIHLESYKQREVKQHERVSVYRNLHEDKLSICVGGLVHGHSKIVMLKDVEFVVQSKGNKRVNSTGQKNVHAYVKGNIVNGNDSLILDVEELYANMEQLGYTRVYYNPYKVDSFVIYDTLEPVYKADEAFVIMDRVYI